MRGIAWFVFALAASAQSPEEYRLQKEMAMGRILASEVERQERVIDPDKLIRAGALAGRLAQQAGLAAPLTLKILDAQEPRTIPLPGGFLFVSTGLLSRMGTEAETAAVLAHGIAHIALRHGWHSSPGRESIPVVYTGTVGSGACRRFPDGGPFPAGLRQTAEKLEEEADAFAARLLRESGYDPSVIAEAFRKAAVPLPRPAPSLYRKATPTPLP